MCAARGRIAQHRVWRLRFGAVRPLMLCSGLIVTAELPISRCALCLLANQLRFEIYERASAPTGLLAVSCMAVTNSKGLSRSLFGRDLTSSTTLLAGAASSLSSRASTSSRGKSARAEADGSVVQHPCQLGRRRLVRCHEDDIGDLHMTWPAQQRPSLSKSSHFACRQAPTGGTRSKQSASWMPSSERSFPAL